MKSKYNHLSKDELIAQLIKRDSERKLGLVWERDQIEHDRALNGDFVALNFVPELSVGSDPYRNILIEGDNFDALRYLSIAFRGRIKCIYIDPPYNTGNKDFIYNDQFVDKEDAYKHSKWLEFMYRRLTLSLDLLADDGAIFVSINDENRAKLELLLDQVFPGMRIGSLTWRKRRPSNARVDFFYSSDHEHVLVYGGPKFVFKGSAKKWSGYTNWDENRQDYWASDNLTLGFTREQRKNLYFPLFNPVTDIWYPCDPNNVWRYATKQRLNGRTVRTKPMEDMIAEKRINFPEETVPAYYSSMDDLVAALAAGSTPSFLDKDPNLSFWVGKNIGRNRPRFKRYRKDLKNDVQPLSSWIAEVGTATNDESNSESSYQIEAGMTT